MSSLNLVRTYILALENSGRIERTRLGNIDMLPKLKPSGVAITPIVGSIACGQPVDAVEQIEESVTLPRAIFGGGDLFILHTHGDSMIDIGIKHGDLVVIRKQNTAENGDIIVAMIWNAPSTLKVNADLIDFNFQSLFANKNNTVANAQMCMTRSYVKSIGISKI